MQTLREELRKVQSSAALLERQRNPGVGYWTARSEPAAPDVRTSVSSTSSDSRVASPAPTSPKNEEEVNLEYLRNVILQFLEHKEMRVSGLPDTGFWTNAGLAEFGEGLIDHLAFYTARNTAIGCKSLRNDLG